MVLSAKYGRTQWRPGVAPRAKKPTPPLRPTYGVRVGQAHLWTIKLLTNAIKDTVSVLYWYEELSS